MAYTYYDYYAITWYESTMTDDFDTAISMGSLAKAAVLNRIRKLRDIDQDEPCYFLKLPQELRDMVYDLILKVDHRIGLMNQIVYKKRYRLPGNGLITTCQQIRTECQRVLCSNPILIASTNERWCDFELTIPHGILANVRDLTVHLSAPEINLPRNMRTLRLALLKASFHSLRKLDIRIFPFRGCQACAETLIGSGGRHDLRKTLGPLRQIKVQGQVTIEWKDNTIVRSTRKPRRGIRLPVTFS